MIPLLFVAMLFTLLSMFAMAAYVLWWRGAPRAYQRLLEVTHIAGPAGNAGRAGKFGDLSSASAAWLRAHFSIVDDAGLQARFARAGWKGPIPGDTYLSARILGPLVMLTIGSLLPSARVFWMVTLPCLAYLAPDVVLERAIGRRRESIRRSIPDVIDLLVICVDAGLGLDQAIQRVGQELALSHPEINDEFLQLNREQRAGRPRAAALLAMAERIRVPDMDAFVNMLLQTERFGTPIARALSTFAAGVRTKRRLAAEELAAKTTIKIIFPLVFFIFPAIFVVLLGPAALAMIHGIHGF